MYQEGRAGACSDPTKRLSKDEARCIRQHIAKLLVDAARNVIAGSRYDASLDDIEAFLNG